MQVPGASPDTFERVHPIEKYDCTHFMESYRIDKAFVHDLARHFRESDYCTTLGLSQGDGITIEDKVYTSPYSVILGLDMLKERYHEWVTNVKYAAVSLTTVRRERLFQRELIPFWASSE